MCGLTWNKLRGPQACRTLLWDWGFRGSRGVCCVTRYTGRPPWQLGDGGGGGGGVVQSPAVALVRTSLGCPEAQGASTVALTSAGRQRGGLSGPHSSLGPGGQESLHLPHEG